MTGAARVEVRAAAEMRAAGRKLEGWAAVFDTPARIGNFTEVVRRSAFDAALASGADVIGVIDHDPGKLLARRSSGTLRLSVDGKGLAFSLDVPDTQLGRDTLTLAERGDLGGCSFSFRCRRDAWPARDRRELLDVELIDVAIVQSFPAYPNTAVAARARQPMTLPTASFALRRRLLEAL